MRALEDQIAAGEEYLHRADLFYNRRSDDNPPRPFPWDHWEQWAREDGLSATLAELGAAVICAAHIDDWTDQLRAECGWHDAGRGMIGLAQQDPERARVRWSYLLESKGDFHATE
ncbi:hypothetical protein [Aeoliella sp. SH292]|uniref:hypothetical protein n=1 Tax=Aeoliella sp. SH292 TaxID=3454464 RepID=UPI003F96570C